MDQTYLFVAAFTVVPLVLVWVALFLINKGSSFKIAPNIWYIHSAVLGSVAIQILFSTASALMDARSSNNGTFYKVCTIDHCQYKPLWEAIENQLVSIWFLNVISLGLITLVVALILLYVVKFVESFRK